MDVKILLADDHEMICAGLRVLLDNQEGFDVVGEAHDGRTAVRMIHDLSPDVVVMDVRMPELNGIEAARQTVESMPGLKVIGLSSNSDERTARNMLAAGASGYVLKEAAFDDLVKAIQAVMSNKVYLSPALASRWSHDQVGGPADRMQKQPALSPREREVLQLLAEGKATKEVAASLSVSVKTAETHRRNLMEKLQIDSVAELTKYAIREGISDL